MTAFVNTISARTEQVDTAEKAQLFESIERLTKWLERNDYRGYDTFDGLNANLRPVHLRKQVSADGAAAGRAPIPLEPSPGPWHQEELLHEGHGLSGQGIHAPAGGHGRSGMAAENGVRAPMARSRTSRPVTPAPAGEITSIISRGPSIYQRVYPPSCGPRSSDTRFWMPMITSGANGT